MSNVSNGTNYIWIACTFADCPGASKNPESARCINLLAVNSFEWATAEDGGPVLNIYMTGPIHDENGEASDVAYRVEANASDTQWKSYHDLLERIGAIPRWLTAAGATGRYKESGS